MLFKKSSKSFLDKEIGDYEPQAPRSVATAFVPPMPEPLLEEENEKLFPLAPEPQEVPDAYLGPGTTFQGELEFPQLLRIDGKFQGKITSSGRIIVGPDGHVKADIRLAEAFVSGKIEGDICVQDRLVLRGRAEVYGNITAPVVSVDEGVTIVGQICVSTKNASSST